MTVEEFLNTGFRSGDNANYKGKEYPIAQVDFEECLIGLLMEIPGGDPDDVSWVRCENITLVPFQS